MSESEHLHSEFYYPGEQSDAELLQLRTYNEATERKSLLLNQENKKFIASQQMLYDTMYMIKFLLTEWGWNRPVEWMGTYLALGQDTQTLSQIFSCPALPLSQ